MSKEQPLSTHLPISNLDINLDLPRKVIVEDTPTSTDTDAALFIEAEPAPAPELDPEPAPMPAAEVELDDAPETRLELTPEAEPERASETESEAASAKGLLSSVYLRAGLGGAVLMSGAFAITFTGAFGLIGGAGAEIVDVEAQTGSDEGIGAEHVLTFEQMPHERFSPEDEADLDVTPAPVSERFGQISRRDGYVYYSTERVAISLPSETGLREITLSIGLQTSELSAAQLLREGETIKGKLKAAVQSIKFAETPQWAMPGLICADLETQLRGAYPEAQIKDVLIRSFEIS